eukprot:TRINITY_DN36_c0_g1_i2.p2 TRINITY_DN36_c0_g1~~TRINITY_DN36_c0_g1_i2.p2  ORF type:complete len:210 (-),score=56.68 TRINITY_DN36_c0_g1_i2:27-656(-)
MRLDEKTSKCNKKCRKFGKAECPARCKVEGDDCVDPEEASDGDYCEDATVTNAEWYNPRTTLAAAKAACNDDSNCIGLYQGKDKKTKGRSNFSQWVKTYKVQVGETTSSLIDVDGGKLFGGNSNRSTKVEQTFAKPVMARYVRILPMSWTGHVSMRAAVLVEECVPEESESTDPSEEECQAKESKNACLMRKCGWNEKKEKVPTAWPLV